MTRTEVRGKVLWQHSEETHARGSVNRKRKEVGRLHYMTSRLARGGVALPLGFCRRDSVLWSANSLILKDLQLTENFPPWAPGGPHPLRRSADIPTRTSVYSLVEVAIPSPGGIAQGP